MESIDGSSSFNGARSRFVNHTFGLPDAWTTETSGHDWESLAMYCSRKLWK